VPGLLPLPCIEPTSGCGSGNIPYSNPLSNGASHDDIQTTLDVIGASEIPVVSQIADVGSGLMSFSQGDNLGGILSMGAALPGVGNIFAGMKWGRRGLNALEHAKELGKAGEKAAGITKPKSAIKVDGRNLFPDDVDVVARSLTEVKNVKSLSLTRQLRDYNKYAKSNNFKFVLVTRPGTKLSRPLRKAIESGDIIHRPTLPF
jgi:hypothetical protein